MRGAVSGKPVESLMNDSLRELYARMDRRRYRLMAAGGVFSAEDAYRKIRLGASLVQLITALIYEGPAVIGRINEGLCELLERDGFQSIADAVRNNAMTTRCKIMLVLLALVLGATSGSATAGDGARPNILIAIADDMSWAHTSVAGCKAVRTPNLDRVARSGVMFRNGFCGAPGCSPSRAALLLWAAHLDERWDHHSLLVDNQQLCF